MLGTTCSSWLKTFSTTCSSLTRNIFNPCPAPHPAGAAQAIPLRAVVARLEDTAARAGYTATIDQATPGSDCSQSKVLRVLQATKCLPFAELYQVYYDQKEQGGGDPVREARLFVSLTILLFNWYVALVRMIRLRSRSQEVVCCRVYWDTHL
jgi:hypothetical protein